ncbi:MAG: glutamate racemase [Formosimonas sp.]
MTELRAAQGAPLTHVQAAPIGVFDSGIGGLSVWRHLRATLPHENFIYLADTLNVPYGGQTEDWIRERMNVVVQWFLAQGCKTVVMACNTATAAAATYLRERYPDLFLVGLEPAIKPALQLTRNKTIAMLATARTVGSAKYARLLERCVGDEFNVLSIACVGLAERIDAGEVDSPATIALLEHYLAQAQGADVIVLGCTHYPFMAQHIRERVSEGVQIIDSGAPVARYTRDVLLARDGLNPQLAAGQASWYASQTSANDAKKWGLFCGQTVDKITPVLA